MASFLAGPAAHLVGAGLQAAGVGIPVSNNCNKLLEGMRDCGLPVPPKTWFKPKDDGRACQGGGCWSRAEPKKNVYDKLESHIQGVMQVVKPVMELKGVIASGCKSADRGQRVGNPCSSGRTKRDARQRSYSIDEGCRSDACRSASPRRFAKKKPSLDRECRIGLRRGCPVQDSSDSSEEDEEVCMYCERARCSMLKLPCGRVICAKCDKTEGHELQCKQCKKLSS